VPNYEYECTVCKHRFELLQKFSDEPAKICVRCGAPVVKLLSSPAIKFKGTGWYVTDYGKGGGTAEAKKHDNSESSAEKSSAEKKPAASPDSSSKDSSSATKKSSSASAEPAKT